MNYSYAGKVVIVTGASSGIGAATAALFGKLGASLSLSGRNAENLASVAKECGTDKILMTVGDITSPDVQKKLVADTLAKFGSIDVLVNSAGMMVAGGNVSLGSIEQYDTTMNVNVRSVIQLSQLCIEPLKKSQGCVINVSSIASMKPSAVAAFYYMSKAALDSFTKCFASEMAPFKVRVNSVNPAFVRTNFISNAMPDAKTDLIYAAMCKQHALGRVGEPSEIATQIAHLAHHERSAWTTGICMPVEGGLLLDIPTTPVTQIVSDALIKK
jgi:NAD(P)-dependent dehydrogenase (short-subunit alcohol dehydrogenase family)